MLVFVRVAVGVPLMAWLMFMMMFVVVILAMLVRHLNLLPTFTTKLKWQFLVLSIFVSLLIITLQTDLKFEQVVCPHTLYLHSIY
jgi:hypothetical protein